LIYLNNVKLFSDNKEWNMAFAGKCIELYVSMLSKANHVQKDQDHIFSHMLNLDLKYIERYIHNYDYNKGNVWGVGWGGKERKKPNEEIRKNVKIHVYEWRWCKTTHWKVLKSEEGRGDGEKRIEGINLTNAQQMHAWYTTWQPLCTSNTH
jgi:hypothetical protein